MTTLKSLLASLAFWRVLSLVLALTVTLLVGFIIGQRPGTGEQGDSWNTSDVEAFTAFLQEAEDQDLNELRQALGQMIEGQTEFSTEGQVEEMRKLFDGIDVVSIYRAREAVWLSMMAVTEEDWANQDFEVIDHNETDSR